MNGHTSNNHVSSEITITSTIGIEILQAHKKSQYIATMTSSIAKPDRAYIRCHPAQDGTPYFLGDGTILTELDIELTWEEYLQMMQE